MGGGAFTSRVVSGVAHKHRSRISLGPEITAPPRPRAAKRWLAPEGGGAPALVQALTGGGDGGWGSEVPGSSPHRLEESGGRYGPFTWRRVRGVEVRMGWGDTAAVSTG